MIVEFPARSRKEPMLPVPITQVNPVLQDEEAQVKSFYYIDSIKCGYGPELTPQQKHTHNEFILLK